MECSQIYCCNFLSVQCELGGSFFFFFFFLHSIIVFRSDLILKSKIIALSEVNKMISQNGLFEVEIIHALFYFLTCIMSKALSLRYNSESVEALLVFGHMHHETEIRRKD